MMMRSRANSGGAVGASSSSKSVSCSMIRRVGATPLFASGGGRGTATGGVSSSSSSSSSTAAAATTSTARHQRQLQRQRRAHHGVWEFAGNGGATGAMKKSQRTLLARCVVTAAEVANGGASADAELPELAPRPVLPGLAAAPVRPVPQHVNGNGNGNGSRNVNGNGAGPRHSERGKGGVKPKSIAVPPPPMAKSTKKNRKKTSRPPASTPITSTPRAADETDVPSPPAAAASSVPMTDTTAPEQQQSVHEPPKRPVTGKKKKKLDAEEKRALADAERESKFMQRYAASHIRTTWLLPSRLHARTQRH